MFKTQMLYSYPVHLLQILNKGPAAQKTALFSSILAKRVIQTIEENPGGV